MTRNAVLGLAVATGPIVWLLTFGADFALSGWTCGAQSRLPQYILSVVSIVLTGAAMWAAWVEWRAAGKGFPGESGGPAARARSVAIVGIALNAMFLVVAIAQTIPHLMLGGCE